MLQYTIKVQLIITKQETKAKSQSRNIFCVCVHIKNANFLKRKNTPIGKLKQMHNKRL